MNAQPGQSWTEVGKLSLKYIDTAALNASAENWSITQDSRDILYVGNSRGLLIHDGVSWQLIPIPEGNIVRSLAVGPDDSIYIGSFGQFGYLGSDSLGMPAYVSLMAHVPPEYHDFAYLDEIMSFDDSIFFYLENTYFDGKTIKSRYGKHQPTL